MDAINRYSGGCDCQHLLSNRIGEERAHYGNTHASRDGYAKNNDCKTQNTFNIRENNSTSKANISNLNLVLAHIDSMITREVNALHAGIKAVRAINSYSISRDEHESQDQGSIQQVDIDLNNDNLIQLMISLHEYIQNAKVFNEYKIYGIHKRMDVNPCTIRRLIMMIPFERGQSTTSGAYFFGVSPMGKIVRNTFSVELIGSGYLYNRDWIVMRKITKLGSLLDCIEVNTYDGERIDGYCLSSLYSEESEKFHEYLYIEGFGKAWNSEGNTSNV